jgi:hypothetical protein
MVPFLLDVPPVGKSSEPLVIIGVVVIVIAVAVVVVATGVFVFVRVRRSQAAARTVAASWASGQSNSPSGPGAQTPNL